jgi:CheY-like chemotaxis protein
MMKTILLLERDEGVRRMLSRLLTEEGYSVLVVADQDAALAKAAELGADLVITDCSDPATRNGSEKSPHPPTGIPAPPVIWMTESPNPSSESSPQWAWLEKPLDLPKLLQVIRAFLAVRTPA